MAKVAKKTVKKKKPVKETPVVVTQVVEEVVLEEATKPPLADIQEKVPDLERSHAELEPDSGGSAPAKETSEEGQGKAPSRVKTPGETEAADLSENKRAEEARKEVVKELFQPDKGEIMPEISVYKNRSTKELLVWAAMVLTIALLTGTGLFIAVSGMPKLPLLVVKPTPTPTPAPTPTPTPTPARQTLKIQVLNGGGVPGSAGKMKEFLEEKGYKVEDVGNTEEYTYKNTEILVKPGKESYLSLFSSDLEGDYTIGSSSATLSEDSPYDVQIIVGKE